MSDTLNYHQAAVDIVYDVFSSQCDIAHSETVGDFVQRYMQLTLHELNADSLDRSVIIIELLDGIFGVEQIREVFHQNDCHLDDQVVDPERTIGEIVQAVEDEIMRLVPLPAPLQRSGTLHQQ